MPHKVTGHQKHALKTLAQLDARKPGGFWVLQIATRKTRDLIVTQGYAETKSDGGLTLYRITDAGRRAVRAALQEERAS